MDEPEAAGPGLRVLLVDDHPLFLAGLRMLVEQSPGLVLLGTATTGEEAVRAAAELAPDVVVMDVQLPGLSGVQATAEIVRRRPATAVLIVTMFEEDEVLFSAMRAGARGYVLKGAGTEEIAHAIAGVAAGQVTFGGSVAARIMSLFDGPNQARRPSPFPELTERELHVLRLLAEDLGNATIARRLGIEPKTVRNYVSAILVKLQARDRQDAADRARRAGLGPGAAT